MGPCDWRSRCTPMGAACFVASSSLTHFGLGADTDLPLRSDDDHGQSGVLLARTSRLSSSFPFHWIKMYHEGGHNPLCCSPPTWAGWTPTSTSRWRPHQGPGRLQVSRVFIRPWLTLCGNSPRSRCGSSDDSQFKVSPSRGGSSTSSVGVSIALHTSL